MSQPFNPLRLQPNLLLPALIMGVFLAITGLPQIDTIYTLWHPGRAIVFNDFMIHWEAARLVAAGRAAEVYDRAALTAGLIADFGLGQTIYRDGAMAWSYFYSPTGLLLIWPLGLMDYSMAALTMVGGGVGRVSSSGVEVGAWGRASVCFRESGVMGYVYWAGRIRFS
jgi:hypothetical protein